MDKLKFGTFDEEEDLELVFDKDAGYIEPSSENETRRQLSKPLTELRDYVNNTVTVNSSNSEIAYQLALTNDKLIKYRTGPNDTWKNTSSSGHTIEVVEDDVTREMTQRAVLRFENVDATDDGTATVIRGIKGDKGDRGDVGPSYVVLGHYDTYTQLVNAHGERSDDPAVPGDIYAVGTSTPYHIYIWLEDGTTLGFFDIGTFTAGPQGPKGDSGTFEILDLVEELPTASSSLEGKAYAMEVDSEKHIYICNGSEWVDLGQLRGPKGEKGDTGAVPDEGFTGQVLAKKSEADGDTEWISLVDVGQAISDNNNTLHPTGSIVIGPSAPAMETWAWENFDKEFSNLVVKNTDTGFDITQYFTASSDNIKPVNRFEVYRSAKSIRILMRITNNVEFGSSDKEVGTLVLNKIGLTGCAETSFCGFNDSVGAMVWFTIDSTGKITEKNTFRRATASSNNLVSNNTIDIDISLAFTKDQMDSSACDKFYWRRTS